MKECKPSAKHLKDRTLLRPGQSISPAQYRHQNGLTTRLQETWVWFLKTRTSLTSATAMPFWWTSFGAPQNPVWYLISLELHISLHGPSTYTGHPWTPQIKFKSLMHTCRATSWAAPIHLISVIWCCAPSWPLQRTSSGIAILAHMDSQSRLFLFVDP